MATFKHISSKNADYGAAEQYLTFEHDEFTMKPTLDKNGRLVLRDDYRISSLNCGGEDFAIACMRSNLKYGKNQKREDVKSHHYIISFDPRDATDNGLTVDRAQQLGEQFCKEHFPGHQALVCTHPDGHNHSGNIHVHIVINSLRIAEVPLLPYMERPADTKEGCKHRCTDAAMEYFKAEVMEMCHRENLYQIDLLHGSKNRVTEREYWAKRKGQVALDKENASLAATGEPPKITKFETDKEKLRGAIRAALSSTISFEDFSGKLLQQGVTVKESRGRLSYLTPDRTKPITARKLGDDFDRTAVLALLEQNAQNAARAAETPAPKQEYPRSIKDRLQRNKAAINAPKQGSVQRMVDREAKRAEGKGIGYDRWAAVHNLKQMAATMSIYEESGFSSPEELEAALAAASAELSSVHAELKAVESTLHEKKDLQKQLLAYIKTKPARDGLKAQKTEKARRNYREQHESDFMIAEAATRYFKAQGIQKLPASKTLQAEIEQLMREKNSLYNEYREKREKTKELQTVKNNIGQILRREPERGKGRDNER
ncbi:relaxase/mobilization nuclease domain-containing protein [Lachnospiraceae bacterium MD308]|nr:relaxase/mobilization nuclease domain-containing protein [Lachnospiraceae bacterium MD308]